MDPREYHMIEESDDERWAGWTKPERISMQMEFTSVDPTLLGILTGGALGEKPEPTFALEVTGYHKRKWWQWLLRRPRQRYHYTIPNARLSEHKTYVKVSPSGPKKMFYRRH